MSSTQTTISWILRILAAGILLQNLYFKFTGHPDSVELFNTVGLGDAGRIGIGIFELVAAILLLIPSTIWIGSVLTLGVITSALMSHFCFLSIDYKGDGGILFGLATTVLLATLITLWLHRRDIPFFDRWGKNFD